MRNIEIQQAFYTRCRAPYSDTKMEGYGWRYFCDDFPDSLLIDIIPYLDCASIEGADSENTRVMIYLYLHGYHILIHSTSITTDPRGGNFFSHIVFIKDLEFCTLDAVCNIFNKNWITQDTHNNNWNPCDNFKLYTYTKNKNEIFECLKNIIESDSSSTLIDTALQALEYLLRTECLSPIIIISPDSDLLKQAIQIIIFSLPEHFIQSASYINIANEYSFSHNRIPLIIGWLDKPSYTQKLNETVKILNIQDSSIINFSALPEACEYRLYINNLKSIWLTADKISEIESYINWVSAYTDNQYRNPLDIPSEKIMECSILVGMKGEKYDRTDTERYKVYKDIKKSKALDPKLSLLLLNERKQNNFLWLLGQDYFLNDLIALIKSAIKNENTIWNKITRLTTRKSKHHIYIPESKDPETIYRWIFDHDNFKEIKEAITKYNKQLAQPTNKRH